MLTSEECLKQFVNDFSNRLEKPTLKSYETSIRQLLTFCGKNYDEITKKYIRNWLMYLKEEGYKPATIKNKIKALRLFYQYCLEEDIINCNPAESIPYPREEDKLPHYLTNEQLAQLRLICEGKLKQRAIIEVLYTTGVRISELINLKLEDVNWTERMIHIPKGKGKKERIVLFTKECAEHLKSYLQTRNEDVPFVFLNRNGTGSITCRNIQYWFTTYRKNLGIFMTPHTLRHTFAAHLAMKGMPLACLQVLLGHDKARLTHLYARLHGQAQKQMYDQWM